MSETTPINLKALAEPFEPKDIEWRIGQAGKKGNGDIWAKVLAYITNRAIMNRLDDVCGPGNWRNEFAAGPNGGVVCGISIRVPIASGIDTVTKEAIFRGDYEWVTKWDGAENTDIEAIKGGLSDAMKRAGVQWGIGRYLYNLDEGWAVVGDKGDHHANCKVKVNGKEEWVNFRWSPPELPAWAIPKAKPPAPKAQPTKPTETKPAETLKQTPLESITSTLTACGCGSPAEANSISLFVCGVPWAEVKTSEVMARKHYQAFAEAFVKNGVGLRTKALEKHPITPV